MYLALQVYLESPWVSESLLQAPAPELMKLP